MFETIAAGAILLLGAAIVFIKARGRLKTPGARRSRRDDGAGAGAGASRHEDAPDGGDGGGDGGGGGGD